MKKIISTLIVSVLSLNAQFIAENKTIKDTTTNLQWQDSELSEALSWEDALKECDDLAVSGYINWRLPNINELKSIIDIEQYSPALDGNFTQRFSNNYWSSTTNVADKQEAWSVDFNYGEVAATRKDTTAFVRCVRDYY